MQGFPSLQGSNWPATQFPPAQVSATVQTEPSLQGRVFLLKMQPILASQLSVVQPFWSSQTVAGPGKQVPP